MCTYQPPDCCSCVRRRNYWSAFGICYSRLIIYEAMQRYTRSSSWKSGVSRPLHHWTWSTSRAMDSPCSTWKLRIRQESPRGTASWSQSRHCRRGRSRNFWLSWYTGKHVQPRYFFSSISMASSYISRRGFFRYHDRGNVHQVFRLRSTIFPHFHF